MKKPKVSIVIPIYKPQKEILNKIREMLKKQTIKAEIVENWNMPEAQSTNTGIRKAKGEIIVTLSADCIPEDEFWLEKLIKPLENKNVVASVSDLYLPKWYWKKYPFLIKIFTIPDRRVRKPTMDARGCAYRKKELKKAGLFNEDLKVIAIEKDLAENLRKIGKIVRANIKINHLHNFANFRKVINTYYTYSKANGMVIRKEGICENHFFYRIARAIPFLGLISIFYRFPFEKYLHLFPFYMVFAAPLNHIINIVGFWNGFFFKQKESPRNTQVLNEKIKN